MDGAAEYLSGRRSRAPDGLAPPPPQCLCTRLWNLRVSPGNVTHMSLNHSRSIYAGKGQKHNLTSQCVFFLRKEEGRLLPSGRNEEP